MHTGVCLTINGNTGFLSVSCVVNECSNCDSVSSPTDALDGSTEKFDVYCDTCTTEHFKQARDVAYGKPFS